MERMRQIMISAEVRFADKSLLCTFYLIITDNTLSFIVSERFRNVYFLLAYPGT